MNLSKRQRQILRLMFEHGTTAFQSRTRRFHWFIHDTGLVINCYQYPEYFLVRRNLIARVESNSSSLRYRLTAEGLFIAGRLRG